MSGTYYIGTSTSPDASRTYATLPAAMSALGTNGVGGAVTFQLLDASYGLTATLTVPAPTGASATNTITIQPAAGVAPVISGSVTAANGGLVAFSGTDYLTVNGNDGSGGQAITIRNNGNGPAVTLLGDATYNGLRYLTLESANTSTSSGTVFFGAAASASGTGNDFNTVASCVVRPAGNSTSVLPANGIYSSGTAGATNSDNTVRACTIYNFTAAGVNVTTNSGDNWTLGGPMPADGNAVYETVTRSSGDLRYLRLSSGNSHVVSNNQLYYASGTFGAAFYGVVLVGGAGHTVSSNAIGGSQAGAGGAAFTLTASTSFEYPIYLDLTTTAGAAATTVQNNTIRNFSSAATGTMYGIHARNGTAGIVTMTGNVVGGTGSGQGITHAGTFYGIDLGNAVGATVQNNSITGITTTVVNSAAGTQIGTLAGVNVSSSSACTIGNNTFGSLSGTVTNAATATTVSTASATPVAGVYVSGSGVATITGNTISNLSSASTYASGAAAGNVTLAGVWLNGSAVSPVTTNTISGVAATAGAPAYGVLATGGSNQTITGNTIGTLSNSAGLVAGIYVSGAGTSTIATNQVSGVSNTIAATGTAAEAVGIYTGGAGGVTLDANTIGTLSTTNGLLNGLNVAGTGAGTVSNNQVSNLTSAIPTGGTGSQLVGINVTGAAAVAVTGNTVSSLTQTGLSGNLYGIQNNNTTGSNVTGNTVSGLNYSGKSNQTIYGIAAGGSNTVASNQVSSVQVTGAGPDNVRGIYLSGGSTATPTVTDNTISGVLNASTGSGVSTVGLYMGPPSGTIGAAVVRGNQVSNVGTTNTASTSSTHTVTGLLASSLGAGSVVERNRIWNVYGSTAGTGASADQVRGLAVQSTTSATFANNQVSLAAGSTTQASYGLRDESTGGTNFYYYNTVYLAPGPAAVTNISYGFLRSNGTPPAVTLLNNVLYNGRTPASGTPALAIGTAATGTFTSNYNLLIAPNASVMSNYGNVLYSFADWKTQSGGDGSSLSERAVNVPAANLFGAPASGNLDINPANPEAWYVNGNGVQVSGQTADYNSASANRSTTVAAGGTDIGANEFTPSSTPPALTASAAPALGGTQTFTLGGRTLASLTYGSTGTVPTTVTARYYSGTNPPAPYASGARIANYYFDFSDGGTGSGYTYQPTLYYDPALLGTVASETAQQIALRNDDNSGYRAFPTTPNTTARSLMLANGGSFNRLGTLAVSDQAAPLPVTLAAFTALRSGNDAVLNWNSATELNSAGYEVQVSTDGRAYRVLGFVRSQQPYSLTPQYYQYTDREAGKAGIRYYLLRQVDLDGHSAYSPVKAVAFGGSTASEPALLASPNPFSGANLTLTVAITRAETATLTVLDAAGRPALTQAQELPAGRSQLAVPALATLPAGLYLVQLTTESGTFRTRVVKE